MENKIMLLPFCVMIVSCCASSNGEKDALAKIMLPRIRGRPRASDGLTCLECDRVLLKTTNEIRAHIENAHPTYLKNLTCPACSKTYKYASIFMEHLKKYSREYHHACSTCESKFKYRRNAIRHRKAHDVYDLPGNGRTWRECCRLKRTTADAILRNFADQMDIRRGTAEDFALERVEMEEEDAAFAQALEAELSDDVGEDVRVFRKCSRDAPSAKPEEEGEAEKREEIAGENVEEREEWDAIFAEALEAELMEETEAPSVPFEIYENIRKVVGPQMIVGAIPDDDDRKSTQLICGNEGGRNAKIDTD